MAEYYPFPFATQYTVVRFQKDNISEQNPENLFDFSLFFARNSGCLYCLCFLLVRNVPKFESAFCVANMVVIEGGSEPISQKMNGQEKGKKSQKRKRASLGPEMLGIEEKETKIEALRKELNGLFGYYKEVMKQKVVLDAKLIGNNCNAVIAALMEESGISLSKTVQQIFDDLKGNEDFGNLTLPSVKSTVLLVGQRMLYGVPNADVDILEDDSDDCLWCWEVGLFRSSLECAVRKSCFMFI